VRFLSSVDPKGSRNLFQPGLGSASKGHDPGFGTGEICQTLFKTGCFNPFNLFLLLFRFSRFHWRQQAEFLSFLQAQSTEQAHNQRRARETVRASNLQPTPWHRSAFVYHDALGGRQILGLLSTLSEITELVEAYPAAGCKIPMYQPSKKKKEKKGTRPLAKDSQTGWIRA